MTESKVLQAQAAISKYKFHIFSYFKYTQLQKKPISHFLGQLGLTNEEIKIYFIPYSLTIFIYLFIFI